MSLFIDRDAGTAAVIASVLGSAVAVIAVVVTLVGGGVWEDVRTSQAAVDGLRHDTKTAAGGLRDDMRVAIDGLREDHARFETWLDAVEVALGKVDQGIFTIERHVEPVD